MTASERPNDEGVAHSVGDQPTREFVQQVRDALRHLHDRTRLQTHPLTRLVAPQSDRRTPGRGKLLQEELFQAIEALRPDADVLLDSPAGRTYQLLSRRYREGEEAAEVQRHLAIGKTEYYADHQRALDAVVSVLWERWHPDTISNTLLRSDLPDLPRSLKVTGEKRRHNLPVSLASFVGREQDIRDIGELLSVHRLVTLVSAGGCGKTRLALRVAADLLDRFPEGIWFVDLAPLTDPHLITSTIANALGIQEEAHRPLLETLVDVLRSRQLLLLLDNCEHLIEDCARVADALLCDCPSVRILATSREALGVSGELSWRVPSLPIPSAADVSTSPNVAELLSCASVRLFVERARLVAPGFTLTERNAATIAQICRRLDGIPLVIELAAARMKLLAVESIAARLDDQFGLLVGGAALHCRVSRRSKRRLIGATTS